MITRLLSCFLVLLATSAPLFAQWEWVDSSVGADFERVTDIAVDDTRSVIYSVGYFNGSSSFPEIGASAGSEDGFVIKYDLAGVVEWAFSIGGINDDRINGVTVDELTGNIFITGFIEGNFSTDSTSLKGKPGGSPFYNVTNAIGNQDAFVACYNIFGNLIWKKIIGGTDIDRGMDITVNSSGVFMNGFYTNVAGLPFVTSILPIFSVTNNFVIALSSIDGSTAWDAVLQSTSNDYNVPLLNATIRRMGISADENGVYVVTYFGGTTYNVFDGSGLLGAAIIDPNASTNDHVVTSYANNGDHNWSVLYDDVGTVDGTLDITNDCDGVYVSGVLHHDGVTPGGTVINSNHDNFLLSKLDKGSGTEVWLKEFQSNSDHEDYFVGIDADGYGNLYAIGRLRGTSVSLGTDLNYTSGQLHSEVMIAHLHTDGTFQNFEVIAGDAFSLGMSIATYKNEKYVVGGYYNGTLTFDTISTTNSIDNAFVATKDLGDPISYESASGTNIFCASDANPIPTMNPNLPTGGTFSGPAQVEFVDVTTGEINLANSISGGSYTITYSGFTPTCTPIVAQFQLIILADDDASFTYSTDHFCENGPNPTPESMVNSGGTFTASAGLVVSSAGEIDVVASSLGGPYDLIYTTNGAYCPNSDTIQVYIDEAPDPSFAYAQSSYCAGSGTISPLPLALPGGTFSATPSGLALLNTITGEIDINASSVGTTFTIKYLVSNASCQDSSTFDLTILPNEIAFFTYGTDHFCNNESNPTPATPPTSGGTFSESSGLLVVDNSSGEIDMIASTVGGPYDLVYTTNGSCPNSDTIQVYIESAPDPSFAYAQSAYCDGSGTILPSSLADSSGTFSGLAGLVIDNSSGEIDLDASPAGGPYTINYVVSNAYCQDSATFNITINPLEDATFVYPGVHFCNNEANPVATSTASSGIFSAPSEIVVVDNGTGEINVSTSTLGGPYYLVFTTSGTTCANSDSVQIYIESAPNPSFDYSQTAFCDGIGTILPSSLADSSGTFSGPAAIDFTNTTTGEIDINASAVGGPYTIQYLVSNTYCQKSTTFDVSISAQDSLTSVNYSASEYCISDGNQIPVIAGLSGGVFSGPVAIDLVDLNSGEFSPSTSTGGGPFLIKYVTPGSCPDSLVLFLTLYDIPTAYAGVDQELFFTTKSSLEAEVPLIGIGIWSTLSGSVIADEFDINSEVSILSPGTNAFVWTVTNGVCPKAEDEVSIEVQDLFIPQALTPNGDGKNDLFELHSIDDVRCSVQIFNRWGQMLYENSDYQNEWFGQDNSGNQLENDTYFCAILIDDSISFNGYIVLKK